MGEKASERTPKKVGEETHKIEQLADTVIGLRAAALYIGQE